MSVWEALLWPLCPCVLTFLLNALLLGCSIFSDEFIRKLVEEKQHFEKWAEAKQVHVNRPNSMNRYGVILDEFGLNGMLEELTQVYLKPFVALLFDGTGVEEIDR